MIITVLVDNKKITRRPDLTAEKGLSYHISTNGDAILFDTGCGHTFHNNAKAMGVDIEKVNAAVISHRHHDHAKGLSCFLQYNQRAKVYLRKCKEESYLFKYKSLKFNIGFDLSQLESSNDRFVYISQMTEILSNVFVAINSRGKHPLPSGNKYLFSKDKKSIRPDSFDHELFMIIKDYDGIVIFTGCAHSGVLNMVDAALNIFPDDRIKSLVGGFHMVGIPIINSIGGSRSDIELIGEKLMLYPIDKMYTGHCTGMRAYKILKGVLGDRIEYLPTGSRVKI